LIALNSSEEALENNAVFLRDEGFWNLIIDGFDNNLKNFKQTINQTK
jgi:hypothetical protein